MVLGLANLGNRKVISSSATVANRKKKVMKLSYLER